MLNPIKNSSGNLPEVPLLASFYFRLVTHIADGIDSDESFGIYLADAIHQLFVFVLVYDGDHFHLGLLVICADDLVQRSTTVQCVQNIINDVIQVFGNDANSALDVDT